LTVAAIWGFVLLVGLPVSVVRSAVMISAYALVSLAGHRRMSLNALALAALCILMVNPDSLFDVGFQLSFAAMLAILLLLPLVDKQRIQRFLFDRPLLRWLWGLTTVSLAAQVGVAPLIAYYFGRFSTYFLLTNLIVIPAATAILCLALLALLLPATGVLLLQVTAWLNAALTLIASRLPLASIEGLRPSALQTAMVYVIIVSVYLIMIRYDKSV
jgi:competence protein ComEC